MYIRLINFVLQMVTAIMEVLASMFLLNVVFNSHCVLGEEFTISVFLYCFILPPVTVQSLVLFISRCGWCTVGLDPIAIAYNFTAGIAMSIGTFQLLWTLIFHHCRNEFAIPFYCTTVIGFAAGILHLVNGCLCNSYMPHVERLHLKTSKLNSARVARERLGRIQ
ncbi:hypothetical protein KR009_010852 [Drosophila setifemur]|nr:hypothetical protein KR009_010852 [Drosophila setifemur]